METETTYFFKYFRNTLSKKNFRKPEKKPTWRAFGATHLIFYGIVITPEITILGAAKKRCVWKKAIFENFGKFVTFLNTWNEKRMKFPF